MKIVKIILAGSGVIALLFAGFLAYIGMFSKVRVSETLSGPYTFVFVPFKGPYEKSHSAFTQAEEIMKKEGFEKDISIGIYYDNPALVKAEDLRSDCGFLISEKDGAKFAAFAKRFSGVKTVEKGKMLKAEFPYKNALSFMFGPMKVYPALFEAVKAGGYTSGFSIELYDVANGTITYLVPVKK